MLKCCANFRHMWGIKAKLLTWLIPKTPRLTNNALKNPSSKQPDY